VPGGAARRIRDVALGWGPLLLGPALVLLFTPAAWPRWVLMWLLAFVIYAWAKWITWYDAPPTGASPGRHLGYLLLWPGLDAEAFLDPEPLPARQRPARRDWIWAGGKCLLGAALFWGVARLLPGDMPYAVGWVGMVGLVLLLHFGLFDVLSCMWRARGVKAVPLMQMPVASVSVSEFWGKRWNRAFRDLTHRFLFRPLTARLGPRWAILAGFVLSGLVHDVVISVPAGAGYGGPTLFFLLQAPAMLLERSVPGRRMGLGRGWRGWAFTLLVIVGPACLLFHPPFVERIVVPFMHALGAL
jgi:alginate O-acetyltransferase complex protein AlgI